MRGDGVTSDKWAQVVLMMKRSFRKLDRIKDVIVRPILDDVWPFKFGPFALRDNAHSTTSKCEEPHSTLILRVCASQIVVPSARRQTVFFAVKCSWRFFLPIRGSQ